MYRGHYGLVEQNRFSRFNTGLHHKIDAQTILRDINFLVKLKPKALSTLNDQDNRIQLFSTYKKIKTKCQYKSCNHVKHIQMYTHVF